MLGAGLVMALLGWTFGAAAQEPAPPASPPAEVHQLIELLQKPTVQEWLDKGAPAAAPESAPPPETLGQEIRAVELNLARDFRRWVAATRSHVAGIRDGAAQIPQEMGEIGRNLATEIRAKGFWQILFFAVGLLLLGYGCQQAYWSGTRGWRKHVLAIPLDTVGNRLKVVGQRLAYNLLWLLSFAIGSLGALLLFSWPPYLKTVLSAIFLIIVVALLWGALARFVLSPNNPKLRVFPTPDASARHWGRWGVILLAWLFGGFMAMQVLQDFDVDKPVRQPLAYALGLILFVLAIVALWRRPTLSHTDPTLRDRAFNITIAVSVLFAAFWLLWVFGMTTAFWLLLVAVGLPTAISVVDRSVDHILTPPGTEEVSGPPSVVAAAVERGARALLIIGAIWLLAWIFGVDLDTLTTGETMTTRILRGVLNAIIILLVADFAWHVIRTLIDKHIHASAVVDHEADPTEASRRARMRTLLPILRNILFIVFLVMAVLMALSAMGVQIAPLIAGAGVVGVAVGFGAQTLVKDVISGIFYLLDDAFRVGEYIISGSYKGTVESFSLRSIKLRHHRGYLYTVPFGSLGAVQNMSRDWVIDKVILGLTYDTDLDKVKRIIKQVGKELLADPELAPNIIQTLKMQGVVEYGDFAIKVGLKMMCKPGEQFVVRRRAYALIKKAFAENGIEFAFPTVQVAGGEASTAAVQTAALEVVRKPAEQTGAAA
jgi:small-conductance mechanosensitive channel